MLTKVCTKCGVEKTIDCFNNKKNGKYGVRADCKSCVAEYRRANKDRMTAYREAKKSSLAEKQKQYREANKDALSLWGKQYYTERKEFIKKYREVRKEHIAIQKRLWQQNNPSKMKASNARRRAAKIQASPTWADQESVIGMYQLALLFNSTGINLHVDHIVPLNSDLVCGLHCESNLQLLPASDNISKGNRWWPDMW